MNDSNDFPFPQFEFEDWAKRIGGPFTDPEPNYEKNDVESAGSLQNKEAAASPEQTSHPFFDNINHHDDFTNGLDEIDYPGGHFEEEHGFVPLLPTPTPNEGDFGDRDYDDASANQVGHAHETMGRVNLDLPLDSDPQIERLFFGGQHDDPQDYSYDDGDSPTHDLHFLHEDYESKKPFPHHCNYEVSPQSNIYSSPTTDEFFYSHHRRRAADWSM